MNKRIFNFELNEKPVLGFDTGLNAQDFARAKMTQLISPSGSIVYPDGKVETWKPEGVSEHSGTMIIWGPFFQGESLYELINSGRKDEALDAVRFWLRARKVLEESPGNSEPPYPGPAGAIIADGRQQNPYPAGAIIADGRQQNPYPAGAVFFPPARLLKRSLEADGTGEMPDAERWTHPDLEGDGAVSFCAATMLYRIFCGAPPFPAIDIDKLRQDIREGVFIPPSLEAPGLDPDLAEIITGSMSPPRSAGVNKRPYPDPRPVSKASLGTKSSPLVDAISGLIGPPSSRPVSSWIKQLSDEEIFKIKTGKEQYYRKKTLAVKTRRFMLRNTVIIAVSIIALVFLLLTIRGAVRHQAELPSTRGMSPVEVVGTYYGAFDDLDHAMMDACVINKAGSGDINMVLNLYVISRVRQAYEGPQALFLNAREWIESGRPATDKTVFGITDLKIKLAFEDEKNSGFEADYILWIPDGFSGTLPDEDSPVPEEDAQLLPKGLVSKDLLSLVFQKGAWRITEINRTTRLYSE